MYSIVLMAATAAGPNTPASDVAPPVVAAPVAVGCCGGTVVAGCTGYTMGCYGSCYGSACYGGRVGHFHKYKASYGCGGGYSYGGGGWSCFGSCYGSYSVGCWGSCYGSYSYGGCGGCGGCYGAYSYHYGCYGSGYAAPAVVIPVETPAAPAPAVPAPAPKTDMKKDGASLRFQLPAEAKLFVDGRPAAGEGAERAFFTPPLQAGQRYFYDVKAELVVNGQTVVEEKRVIVTAGAELGESFPRLTAAATDPTTGAGR